MSKLKTIMNIICFCVICMACGKLFRYLLIDDTISYTRVMMHEFYNQDVNIDILFVGSSHTYRCIVPKITDEIFQKNTFNGGSSLQGMDGSMEVIREAARNNDIEQVYLELYYDLSRTVYKQRTDMTSTYLLSDYMRPSIDKIRYLLNASSKEHYINSFILARRNWRKIFDFEYVVNLLKKKTEEKYRNYDYISWETESYMGKGYVANSELVLKGTFCALNNFPAINIDSISDDWKKSLIEIIEFCNNKGIKLTLISAPMPNFRLVNVGNYDEYIGFINKLIEGTNVKYYDFNLCREKYIPNDSTIFKDTDHLNCYGAEIFSNVLSEFFTGKISEQELFYDSYNEKICHLKKDIFGIIVNEDKKEHSIIVELVTNGDDDELAYAVVDKGVVIIKGTGRLCKIYYSEGDKGVFEITTYLKGVEKTRVKVEYGK